MWLLDSKDDPHHLTCPEVLVRKTEAVQKFGMIKYNSIQKMENKYHQIDLVYVPL